MRRFYTVLLLLIPLTMLFSGPLTYEELKNGMLSSSTEIRAAEEELVLAELDIKDAKAAYHPTINATLAFQYDFNPMDPITIDAGEISPALSGNYVTLFDGIENAGYQAQIEITQPIITWGKITNAVKLYTQLKHMREENLANTEETLETELKTRLAAIYYLEKMLAAAAKMEADSSELSDITAKAASGGAVTNSTAKQAAAAVLQISATRANLEAELDNMYTSLEVLSGYEDIRLSGIDYTPNEEAFRLLAKEDRDALLQEALSPSRPAIRIAEYLEAAMDYSVRAAKGDAYWKPDVALRITAGYAGTRMPFIETDWYRKDDWSMAVAIAVSGNIWDGGKKLNQQKRALSNARAQSATSDETRNTIKTTLRTELSNLDVSLANIAYYEALLELDREAVERAEKMKNAGNAGRMDVLQAELQKGADELVLLQEKLSLAQSAYTISYLTGDI